MYENVKNVYKTFEMAALCNMLWREESVLVRTRGHTSPHKQDLVKIFF